MDLDQIIKLIPGLGVSGVLVVLVYGIMKGWLVTGREHAGLENQMIQMRLEISKLRDRDESQQTELNELRQKLADEQELKIKAMTDVAALRQENVSLKSQIAELRQAVGGQKTSALMGDRQ